MDEYRVRHAARLMLAAEEAGITIEYDSVTCRMSIIGPKTAVRLFQVTMSKHRREILHLFSYCDRMAEQAINRVQALARMTTRLKGAQ